MDENKSGLYIVGIVAVIAVVALIVLVLGVGTNTRVVTTAGNTEANDNVGNAIAIGASSGSYNMWCLTSCQGPPPTGQYCGQTCDEAKSLCSSAGGLPSIGCTRQSRQS